LEGEERQESNGRQPPDPEGRANGGVDGEDTVEVGRAGEGEAEPTPGRDDAAENGDEEPEIEELRSRLAIKDNHIRELFEQITAVRLEADEARASREAGEGHIEALERERGRLKEQIRALEEELRGRRRRRDATERQVARLERELERRDGEISRRDYLLERRAEEMEALRRESDELAARKEGALDDALRRVEGLQRDLEEREHEASELRATIEDLRGELEAEYDLRERLAEPANRLRAGIDLFNDSEQRRAVNSLSRTLGQPEVYVELEAGEEPPAVLTFTWQGVTWQTYAANPGLAVEEPRVYRKSAGEDLSGVDRQPPNAHVGPGGRVVLGL
jgi:ribonucrease Y